LDQGIILLLAGLLAGAMNALAGGGSFVTMPALLAAGIPSVAANATSTVALWPGGLASAMVYRGQQQPVAGMGVRLMLIVTVIGGAMGALLLLSTPVRLFDQLLPWLALIATVALAFAPRIGPWLQARIGIRRVPLIAGQFLLGVYGGYYGGAVGLMMLAMWSLIDGADIKALAGTRTAMVSAANSVAILCFALAGVVAWGPAALLAGGALVGGYAGAALGKRLPPAQVRAATIALCVAITLAFFARAYL
jgi:uncharacterized protein